MPWRGFAHRDRSHQPRGKEKVSEGSELPTSHPETTRGHQEWVRVDCRKGHHASSSTALASVNQFAALANEDGPGLEEPISTIMRCPPADVQRETHILCSKEFKIS